VNDRAVTSDSDEDTEVSPDGAVTLTGRWNGIAGVVNGGYEVAICTKALALVMPHPDPLVISGFFLRAGTPGPATVRTDLLRAGRCVSSVITKTFAPKTVPKVFVIMNGRFFHGGRRCGGPGRCGVWGRRKWTCGGLVRRARRSP
jgi:Thioesterase-like superfamily